jgi:hypothetical protein
MVAYREDPRLGRRERRMKELDTAAEETELRSLLGDATTLDAICEAAGDAWEHVDCSVAAILRAAAG